MVASSLSFAVPLVLFLLIGGLSLVLTASTRLFRRGERDRLVALAAALPADELGPARALMRASRTSVRVRRLGWLVAIAVTVVALCVEAPGEGDTFVIFGCGYLAAVALGEAMMPKPEPGRPQRAVLDARRPRDYVPRWLMWGLYLSVVLGIALCATTIVYLAAVQPAQLVCSRVSGAPLESFTFPSDAVLPLAGAMVLAYAVIGLATWTVLGRIASRARPSGHPALISVDDALRRAAAARVAAAGLGAALLTLPIPLSWLDRSVTSPCWNASQTTDSVYRWLMLGCIVAGLAALTFVPSGARQFTAPGIASDAGSGVGTGTDEGSDS